MRAQLERFFDLMEQAVDTGDTAWLDPLLSLWSTSLTQTDLESGQSSMTQFIKEIMLQTNQVCRETLDSEKALDLMAAVIPCFAHAFEQAKGHAGITHVDNACIGQQPIPGRPGCL